MWVCSNPKLQNLLNESECHLNWFGICNNLFLKLWTNFRKSCGKCGLNIRHSHSKYSCQWNESLNFYRLNYHYLLPEANTLWQRILVQTLCKYRQMVYHFKSILSSIDIWKKKEFFLGKTYWMSHLSILNVFFVDWQYFKRNESIFPLSKKWNIFCVFHLSHLQTFKNEKTINIKTIVLFEACKVFHTKNLFGASKSCLLFILSSREST